MAAPYTLKWYQTFGNGLRNLFSKQLIKCPGILSKSKRASVDDFPSKISAAKAIEKGPQLYPLVCFWIGEKLTMISFTQFKTFRFETIINLNSSIATKTK